MTPTMADRIQNSPVPTTVVSDAFEAARSIAAEIGAMIDERPDCVLGLATGHTPIATYSELVRLHVEEGLSFRGVRTFNLDEYVGLGSTHPGSFEAFMEKHLFSRVDLLAENCHLPDARGGESDCALAAARYEDRLRELGGLDLLILGIGRNGHIAFNEPGSTRDSRTRMVELSATTIAANAADFPIGEEVPERALTMGIATILEARRLRVLAFGAHKQTIVRRTLHDPIGPELPATFLREHDDVELWLDSAAAADL